MSIALITGGSGDIGSAICKRLAANGTFTWIHYHSNEARAQTVLADIKQAGGKANTVQFPCDDEAAIKAAFNHMQAQGAVNVLINNAGYTSDGIFIRSSADKFHDYMQDNFFAAAYLSKLFITALLRNKQAGKIINIASVAGETGNAGQYNYSAAKAALIGLTKSLAKEYGKRGISINAVSPGFIQSDMTEKLDHDKLCQHIPLARFGEPAEVASVVNFLASTDASYINGQVIRVDGGLYT